MVGERIDLYEGTEKFTERENVDRVEDGLLRRKTGTSV